MLTLFRLLARLPLRVLHALGAGAGRLVYAASPTYRRRLKANLSAAIPGASGLVARAAAEAGKAALETPAIWFRSPAEIASLVIDVKGWPAIDAALARGNGIVFLTPHLGCFEITAQYVAQRHPLTVLYRPPRKAWLEPIMMAGRARPGLLPVPANVNGIRALLKSLKRGEAVGMLPDQAPRFGEGAWADFFGRPAYTMTLAGRLARATGAIVLLVFAERLPAARGYRLWIEENPIDAGGESFEANMNRALEAVIRRCPAQYLWGYDRYKVPNPAPARANP